MDISIEDILNKDSGDLIDLNNWKLDWKSSRHTSSVLGGGMHTLCQNYFENYRLSKVTYFKPS